MSPKLQVALSQDEIIVLIQWHATRIHSAPPGRHREIFQEAEAIGALAKLRADPE